MKPTRRKFIIGGVGVSSGLAVPAFTASGDTGSIDPMRADYLRYIAFLAHERKQAWIDWEILKFIRNGIDPAAASQVTLDLAERNNWPMGWMPTEFPKVTALCGDLSQRPADRARAVMNAAGIL